MLNISSHSISAYIDRSRFSSLRKVEGRRSGVLIIRSALGLMGLGLIFMFLPWTQNIRATGNLTALRPEQRPQTIQSVIGGRIEQWYVQEGDFVKKGDTIIFLSEVKDEYFDPQLLARTQEQLTAKEGAVSATVASPTPTPTAAAPVAQVETAIPAVVQPGGNVELIEMDRMGRMIADHMVKSKATSPHVTSFTEADVTNLVMWRDRVKKDFEKREGTKITFTPLFIEAIVRCIKKFPLINCSLDGNNIIIKKDINIGMATALPSGNLIVPVIKSADQLNLVGLTRQVNGLADAARNGKLKVDDTQGGTFTLTNVGTFGSLMGTPIINQPQVAIMAVGAIKKRPVVIETPAGDSIAIRHMMYLSMSYDHRIVDGSLGATFLTAVARELENFNGEREY